MHDVHGIAALPDVAPPAEQEGRANEVVPAYFADYERRHHLPVLRPVRVDEVVEADDGLLEVRAGDRRWLTRTIVNATGTWSRPFVPAYPGAETFRGRQLHPHDYPGPAAFRGRRVVVVGGGASAVQLLGEIAPVAADTLWVTRREPVWRTDDFTPEVGRAAVALVEERVRRGLPPGQRRERHRAGPARAGARGRAARRLRAAPDVRPRSSPTACGCPTARTGRPTSSCGRPASGRPSATSGRSTSSRGTAASSSTAPPPSPTRASSSSATAPPPARSAPTGPAGSPPAASPTWLDAHALSMASSA